MLEGVTQLKEKQVRERSRVIQLKLKQVRENQSYITEREASERELVVEGVSGVREGSERSERGYRERSGSGWRSGGEQFVVKPYAGLVFVVVHFFLSSISSPNCICSCSFIVKFVVGPFWEIFC